MISCLNPLLKMADGFLLMDGFADKIYTYISTIIWNCSLKELSDVSDDDYFKELQAQQLEEWNKRNADQIKLVQTNNVGVKNSAHTNSL